MLHRQTGLEIVTDVFDKTYYTQTRGFMGVKNTWELQDCRAAILGIPFDCGIHPTRIGARDGPRAIRAGSDLVRPWQPPHADINPLEILNVVDCGDAVCTPGRPELSFDRIETAVSRIAGEGVAMVTMGGDGLVSLPQLRAWHAIHDNLSVLHIDAHTDAYPITDERMTPATTFTLAAEEKLIDPAESFHIGARGPVFMHGVFEHTRALGYELIPDSSLREDGFLAMIRQIKSRLIGRKVYVCWDMDVFDPSCAPGVCTPTWGGLTAAEGLALIRSLSGLDIVAFDVNTVSPPHDIGGMTAFLAGSVMLEALTLLTARPGQEQ